jgi:hypothetical protein
MQLRPVDELRWPPPSWRRPAGHLILLAVTALAILAIAAYTAWWFIATGELRERARAWIESRRADGWQLTYAEATRAGFPADVAVRFTNPAVTSPDYGLSWHGEGVRLSTPVLAAKTLQLRIEGQQTLGIGTGSERQEWSGHAESALVDLLPAPGWLPNGDVQVRALEARRTDTGDTLAVGHLELHTLGDPAASTGPDQSGCSMRLGIESLRLPSPITLPFGPEINRLEFEARLFGPLRPSPWPMALADWRDAGGVLEATRITATGGSVALEGEGTFALDKQGQPIGALTARVQGYEQALDRLADAQTIPAHTAAAAKILLRAMTRTGIDREPTLVAPISLQERTLFIGPVPLLHVPKMQWITPSAPAGAR